MSVGLVVVCNGDIVAGDSDGTVSSMPDDVL